jgi:heme a synthase
MSKALGILAILSLIFVFLIVVAGSVVRVTGSGMGCPDWPRCFGRLIPPTDVDQVTWHPVQDYSEGEMIIHDDALWTAKHDFVSASEFDEDQWERYTVHDYAIYNPMHTWIEFMNRILAPTTGIPVFLLWILSMVADWRRRKLHYAIWSTGVVLFMGFEAWLGKVVVEGNLIPGHISLHMAGTFVIIVFLLILIYDLRERHVKTTTSGKFNILLSALLLAMCCQMFFGTQVREEVDVLLRSGELGRDQVIDLIGAKFYIHRSFSILLVLLSGWALWLNHKLYQIKAVKWMGIFMVLEILAGVILTYIDFPAVMQPIHLWLSVGIFSFLVWTLILTLRRPRPLGELK